MRQKEARGGRARAACFYAAVTCSAWACAGTGGPPAPAKPGAAGEAPLLPEEAPYLADLTQLTFGGENAEAYFSFDGAQISFQSRRPQSNDGCDRIWRMPIRPALAAPVPVSSGKGATTCAHFFPSGDLLFASTHLAGAECPPKADMSRGYVWALHASYDIFAAAPDGSGLRRLTEAPGYDAEGTVCAKDGAVIFTSVRDGDLELYRMDRDGKNVKRLTHTPGYDGGAFFNADCTKIVWRASRPHPGKELDDYKSLLAQGLVRPTKLELWTANADGTQPMQLTYLDAASFAPFFHPSGDLIVFSSNHAQKSPREFDLWAIRTTGTDLRRITHAPGFDGFPHFSPDGQLLVFASNRATAPGQSDTNLFLARWKGISEPVAEAPPDRILRDIAHLASPGLQGRGVGTEGLAAAGAFLEAQLREIGLAPAGEDGSFRQPFPVVTAVEVGPQSRLKIGDRAIALTDWTALGFSTQGRAEAPVVLAGYGVVSKEHGLDDYAGLDVKGKIALVRRFAPEAESLKDASTRRRLGDIRHKAFLARERGAKALVVVDLPPTPSPKPPDWQPPSESPLLKPEPETYGDAGIPVLMVKRAAIEPLVAALEAKKRVAASIDLTLAYKRIEAFNVAGRIPAGRAAAGSSTRTLILGAHYDHLGLGGRHSLAPDKHEPHVGADDNASGVATLLEVARAIYGHRAELSHDVHVLFFSAEESGLLGSTHYTRARADGLKETLAMMNLDMVGRMRENRVDVLGSDSAAEWESLVPAACSAMRIDCRLAGDGHGPSDQAAFYAAGVPVLHFFTGSHEDYHKPSDTAAKINAAGAAAIARVVENLVIVLDAGPRLAYKKGTTSPLRGDARSFNASLGTIPDYAGPADKRPGVLLSGVRAGGAAEKAGMKRGDVLVRLGTNEIRSVEDLMYVLNASKPGETVTATVFRSGKEVKMDVTFQEARRTQ